MVRWLWCSPVGLPLYFADFADFAVLLFSHVLHDFAHLPELSVLNDGGESTIHSGTQSDDLQWKFRSQASRQEKTELSLLRCHPDSKSNFPVLFRWVTSSVGAMLAQCWRVMDSRLRNHLRRDYLGIERLDDLDVV